MTHSTAEPESGSARVVIADDTAEIRTLMRLMLGQGGYDVVGEAADGAEAVTLVGRLRPDLVVIDLAMPVMDGLEAIPLIRERAPAAKVVVFSGFQAEQMEAGALSVGADAYMEKGLAPAQVIATVAGVLSGARGSAGSAGSVDEGGAVDEGGSVDEGGDTGEMGEELSLVLHELMSPLTVIEGFARMIESRAERLSVEDVVDFSSRIAHSAAHLRELIQSVVDARSVEGGSLRITAEPVDLSQFVAEVVADLGALTEPHPVVLDAVPGVVAHGDPMRLRQVLTNLLSNAAKFSDGPKPITVGVRPGEGGAEVWVADEGPGVPVDRVDQLFGRFSRLGATTPGMGVGLYVSRGIARAHGGDLVLAEPRPGEGARFVLTLPISPG
ncbi:MAG TPA: hybrid sensor histidine kinase/response regulator [Acidimicrobiales bacterium]|jgi:CheY-like chemotaxis protein|nr:hybrid sensor histidine kinase/response regulator [Acidimicrobiales bacterium]